MPLIPPPVIPGPPAVVLVYGLRGPMRQCRLYLRLLDRQTGAWEFTKDFEQATQWGRLDAINWCTFYGLGYPLFHNWSFRYDPPPGCP
jgi:hypothetical protein